MAETPLHKWPTPDDTDRVSAGAAAMRALGDAIDNDVPKIWTGTVQVSTNNSAFGTAIVTFPAGFFTAPPIVNVTAVGSSVWNAYLANTPGAASASVGIRNVDNAAGTATISVHVIAMQAGGTRAVVLPAPPADDDTEVEATP